ncbi:unannotated protein [freshwater metagenome]|uniref:Unannotated protein n=1 Tax=freshwater metagenome TaxID=449393 RepID=A0A6J7Q8R8_9ZZZZ
MLRCGDGVADPRLADVLHAGDEVADLADPDALGRHRLRRDDADLEELVNLAGRHHADLVAGRDAAVDDANVGDDAAVGVVDRVEDERARRGVRIADRRRDVAHDALEEVGDAEAGLRRDAQDFVGVAADDARDLGCVLVWLGRREIDLVEHRHDGEVVLEREVQVREGLRLDALGRIDDEHCALARGQGPRHLVGEVDVPGGVDHVEDVVDAVEADVWQPHGL